MTISRKMLVTATASCLVTALPIGAAAQTDSPVLGTIGIDLPQRLEKIQDAAHGVWFEGPSFSWNLSFNDTVVPKMISDFDDGKLDDFIIRSGWGIGIIGNTNGQLVAKAATPYEFPIGTSVETQWILSPSDEVVAVGRFGRASSGAAGEMVLKGPSGFAFVGVQKDRGILEAMTVVPYGTRLEGGWWVGPDDKVIGVGRLNGSADCLVVISSWGMSVWALGMMSGTPRLVSIHENGTEFGDAIAVCVGFQRGRQYPGRAYVRSMVAPWTAAWTSASHSAHR